MRQIRVSTGLSQRAAASQIRDRTGAGVTQAMISQWERGEQRPSLDSLEAFLVGLDRSLADLHQALTMVEKGETPPPPEDDPIDALLAFANRRNQVDPKVRQRLRALVDLVDIGGLPGKLQEVTGKIGRLEHLMRHEIESLEKQLHELRDDLDVAESRPAGKTRRPPGH
ncbi:MAG: helix-turn-helix domain-containing protein [Thermoanaerobaculia bacterium]|nr:helix-turn-helix domain-containing protein [Thermoanaerobaculia bacterium]